LKGNAAEVNAVRLLEDTPLAEAVQMAPLSGRKQADPIR
jgi:hypothetical protein